MECLWKKYNSHVIKYESHKWVFYASNNTHIFPFLLDMLNTSSFKIEYEKLLSQNDMF